MRVARAHWVLVGLYGLGIAELLRVLVIRTTGARDDEFGVLLILTVVFIFVAIYFVAAIGARNQRPWARILSRTMAVLLFLFFPIGTVWSIFVLRNTRSGRWALSPGNPKESTTQQSSDSPAACQVRQGGIGNWKPQCRL
jgi:hypothetical protein